MENQSRLLYFVSKYRYIAATLIVLAFIAALFIIDAFITFIIEKYFTSLVTYTSYIHSIFHAIIAVFGIYVFYRLLATIVNQHALRRHDEGEAEARKLILRIFFFFVAIFAILLAFGISIADALAGGAIGGVIFGFAAQTIVTGLLAGILVSSSRTLLPGEIVFLKSMYWSNTDILARIVKVNTMYTEGVTQYGNIIRIPNPLLLNYTEIIYLKKKEGIAYPMQVTINADVPADELMSDVKRELNKEFESRKMQQPEILFISKTGGTNVFTVTMHLESFAVANEVISLVNSTFDRHYWQLKAK
ncbi:MAG: mechanosensitive ion channel family protein [Candidatus Micrarchaeaceae archaeon]